MKKVMVKQGIAPAVKNVLSLFLSIVMLLSITAGIDFSAYATSKTQNDALSWVRSQKGKALDYDGVNGAQCVDLIYYYYNYLGVAVQGGDASAYISNSLPSGWKRVYSGFQAGDIAVWKVNHSCGTCYTSSYGHVGIITSADSSGFNAINQNYSGNMYCTENWFNISALSCAIRPNWNTPTSNPNISFSEQSSNSVTNNSAGIHFVTNNPNSATITKFGIRIRKSGTSSWTELIENQTFSMTYTKPYSNYVVGSGKELNYALEAGTTYEWQPLVVVNGSKIYDSKISNFKTTGSNDTSKVVISNVQLVSKSENGFSMSCEAKDNVGVTSVVFCVYHPTKGWEEIKAANNSNNTYSFTYSNADIDGEYTIHVHAFDAAGNYTNYTDYGSVVVDSHKISAKNLTIKLSNTSYTYNSNAKKPKVTVTDENGATVSSKNYSVKYQTGRKNVGRYAVKVTFKGNYTGSKIVYFTIKPKSTSISKLTASKKKFTVKWKKLTSQTTGYEIQYATNSKFTSNKKTVNISKNSTTSKSVSNLKAKKKYYVRVRTYKTVKVNGKNAKIYSSWSKAKSITTKK